MNKILLDTNAYIHFLKGDNKVFDVLGQAQKVFVSVIMLGELFAGFKGGTKYSMNIKLLKKFLSRPTILVLDVTKETARIFGEIKNDLKAAGTPLPMNDIWIAAHVKESGAELITYDKHFEKIKGLRVWEDKKE